MLKQKIRLASNDCFPILSSRFDSESIVATENSSCLTTGSSPYRSDMALAMDG